MPPTCCLLFVIGFRFSPTDIKELIRPSCDPPPYRRHICQPCQASPITRTLAVFLLPSAFCLLCSCPWSVFGHVEKVIRAGLNAKADTRHVRQAAQFRAPAADYLEEDFLCTQILSPPLLGCCVR